MSKFDHFGRIGGGYVSEFWCHGGRALLSSLNGKVFAAIRHRIGGGLIIELNRAL